MRRHIPPLPLMSAKTRGFGVVFVEPLAERLTCSITCHLAFREPTLTRCGHNFCTSCLTQCPQQSASCLVYWTKLEPANIFPNNALKRETLDSCSNEAGSNESGKDSLELGSCVFCGFCSDEKSLSDLFRDSAASF